VSASTACRRNQAVDNFTHTLVGLALADAVALALPTAPSAKVRGLLRLASAFTNNLPDLDFAYAGITPGKLGYLLHHRGHTHTFLAGTVLGALVYVLLVAWARRKSFALSRPETQALAVLSLFGPWTHVGMDALNSYGVHPFWPAHDGWFYGDAVFILEPWFWVLSVPPLALASVTRFGRISLALCLAAALAAAWIMLGVGTALVLTVGSALTVVVSTRLRERGRALFAIGGFIAVILAFSGASRLAKAALLDAIERQPRAGAERVTVLDTVLTPSPAIPLCWQGLVVGRTEDSYLLEVALVSIAPAPLAASACRLEPTGASLGLRDSSRPFTRRVLFQGEHRTSLAEFRSLARSNCYAAAFLRFARTPFFRERGATMELGDLRYDRSKDEGFAELEVPSRPTTCPAWIPPWTPPRRDLVDSAQ
jgi:inner membrane protein